jgi:hypothetical protein
LAIRVFKRGRIAPFIPLSLEGEGDKGGEGDTNINIV